MVNASKDLWMIEEKFPQDNIIQASKSHTYLLESLESEMMKGRQEEEKEEHTHVPRDIAEYYLSVIDSSVNSICGVESPEEENKECVQSVHKMVITQNAYETNKFSQELLEKSGPIDFIIELLPENMAMWKKAVLIKFAEQILSLLQEDNVEDENDGIFSFMSSSRKRNCGGNGIERLYNKIDHLQTILTEWNTKILPDNGIGQQLGILNSNTNSKNSDDKMEEYIIIGFMSIAIESLTKWTQIWMNPSSPFHQLRDNLTQNHSCDQKQHERNLQAQLLPVIIPIVVFFDCLGFLYGIATQTVPLPLPYSVWCNTFYFSVFGPIECFINVW